MPDFAFFNRQFVPLSEAKVGIMTHASTTAQLASKASAVIGIVKRGRCTSFALKTTT